MHATATVHIPQDVHSLYHAHSAASFDTAPRIPPARILDLPVAAAQHRMPQLPPQPPPPPQQNHHHSQQSASSTHAAAAVAAAQPPAPTLRFDKVGVPAMTSDGVVLVDDPLSRCVYLSSPSLSFIARLFTDHRSSHPHLRCHRMAARPAPTCLCHPVI